MEKKPSDLLSSQSLDVTVEIAFPFEMTERTRHAVHLPSNEPRFYNSIQIQKYEKSDVQTRYKNKFKKK